MFLHAGLFGREKSVDSCKRRHTAEGMYGQLPLCQYRQQLSIAFHASPSPFHLLSSVSHSLHMHLSLLSAYFFLFLLCVKGWLGSELQGYNLEETWDPVTDTNTRSLHAALSPPVSHMLVTAAGLCLPGTRRPACLSHSG